MNTDDSRKRLAFSDDYGSSAKRLCQQQSANSSCTTGSPPSNDNSPSAVDHPCIPLLFSVKDMLLVPLEYIFRQSPSSCGQQQHGSPSQTQSSTQQRSPRPLLSRNEASVMIRTRMLAVELDSLIQLSARVLEEQVEWMSFHDEIARSNNLPLRALLPLLLTLGQTFVHQRLQSLQTDMGEVLKELESLADNLRQSSEANWTTAEALLEVGAANAMAIEKRHLSDVQDELAQRIDRLIQRTIVGVTDESAEDGEDVWDSESSQSMANFCRRLWKSKHDWFLSPTTSMPSSSQNSRLSVEPTGKENEPSQHSTNSAVVEESPAFCPASASQHAALALSSLAYS